MIRLSRRDFALGAACAAGSALFLPHARRVAEAAHVTGRPRALLHIRLSGGMDAILTTDPKRKADVDRGVDLSYGESEIVQIGRTALGPLFRGLAEHAPSMAIVNGVLCSTVSHVTGARHAQQMRRVYPADNALGLTGTIGALRRGDAPLSEFRFHIGRDEGWLPPPGRAIVYQYGMVADPAKGLLHQLVELARDRPRAQALARALSDQKARCVSSEDCAPIEVALDLVRRMPRSPLPPPMAVDPKDDVGTYLAAMWRDVAFLFANRLAAAVYVSAYGDWDSHILNDRKQKRAFDSFIPTFSHFLAALQQTNVDGRALIDDIGIVLTSELGRFPVLNGYGGKDHLPEVPVVVMGPGIRPGQYGQTDRRMLSTPISVKTGQSESTSRVVVPAIDDIGTSVLHWFGIEDARSFGYLGRRLDFLLA